MKTYDKPFKDYAVQRCTAIAVELDEAGIGKYAKDYGTNPLYYENAVKYRGGSLYRAIFGYEKLPDKEREMELITKLEFELLKQEYHQQYYFQNLVVGYDMSITGYLWPRETPPRTIQKGRSALFKAKDGSKGISSC